MPTRDDLKDIEPSARLYTEDDAVFMTASLVWKAETDAPVLTDASYLRRQAADHHPLRAAQVLRAVHRGPPSRARALAHRACRLRSRSKPSSTAPPRSSTPPVARIDVLSTHVFGDRAKKIRKPANYLEEKLRDMPPTSASSARCATACNDVAPDDLLLQCSGRAAHHGTKELCRTVSRDIQSLSEHSSYIAGNITFFLDASLGLDQHRAELIIKIFSIASVVFFAADACRLHLWYEF